MEDHSMCRSKCLTPFLQDALDLGPETEVVEKLLEGFPREIIWFDSVWLEEKRRFLIISFVKSRRKRPGCSSSTENKHGRLSLHSSSSWPAGGTRAQPDKQNRWRCSSASGFKKKHLVTQNWFLAKIAPTNNTQETLFYLPEHNQATHESKHVNSTMDHSHVTDLNVWERMKPSFVAPILLSVKIYLQQSCLKENIQTILPVKSLIWASISLHLLREAQ